MPRYKWYDPGGLAAWRRQPGDDIDGTGPTGMGGVQQTSSGGRPDDWQGLATAGGATGEVAPGAGGQAAGGQAAGGRARRFAAWRPRLAWCAVLLLTAVGLFALYLRQSLIVPLNSDGASNMLQAQSMLHGNLLLTGWWASDVTFYTTELPEYALVELFRGLRPDVVHISGAITYTLIVLLGAMLARGRAKGRDGIIRALLAGGIMLAPSLVGGTNVLLQNPNHVGTAVPILVLLLILDRAPERWYVPVVVCVLLAWTQVADQLTLVAATAPVAAVALVRLLRLALRRLLLRKHGSLAEYRYDALLLAAAGLSVELAKGADAALRNLGGIFTHPLPQQLIAPTAMIPSNTRVMGQTIMLLFGATTGKYPYPAPDFLAWYHLIALALAAAGLAVAIATFFAKRMDRVSQIIVAGIVATVAAGIGGTELPALSHAHEVAILLPFGAVLAGRMLPGLLPQRWRQGRVVLPAIGVWVAGSLAALCWAGTWAAQAAPNQGLADWLVSHGYTDGLASYWQADSTTVLSGSKVVVAPIVPAADQPRHWESSVDWYDPEKRWANFVIAAARPRSVKGGALSIAAVQHAFGRPEIQYDVGKYVVMVYDYNLLTMLQNTSFPGNTPAQPPPTPTPSALAAGEPGRPPALRATFAACSRRLVTWVLRGCVLDPIQTWPRVESRVDSFRSEFHPAGTHPCCRGRT